MHIEKYCISPIILLPLAALQSFYSWVPVVAYCTCFRMHMFVNADGVIVFPATGFTLFLINSS